MRLVILSLLLLPGVAWAGPVLAATAFTIGSTAVTWATVIKIGFMVGMAVYGNAKQKRMERRARDAYNASLQDRMVTRITTEAPHAYVYGRARVGSTVVAMFTSGDKDQYKHLVCVHAAHECDAIEEIYIAGKPLGVLDANGGVTSGDFRSESTETATETRSGSAFTLTHTPEIGGGIRSRFIVTRASDNERIDVVSVSGKTVTLAQDYGQVNVLYRYKKYSPRVRVRKHLGSPDDPADAYLMSVVPGKWTANHVLRGYCYTVITLDLNQPEFQGGIPDIHVLLRGKKLLDIRTGERKWSQNNALATYDYLTGEVCNIDAADLPLSDFITAANVCDEAQSFGLRYTFNGVVFSDEDKAQVLERMAQSMAGGIVATTWSIYAGKYTAPVMALDQSDIVGSLAINPGMSDADLYNTVHGQYISAETEYVATDVKPYVQHTYLAADGRELVTNIDLPYTDGVQRAHNLYRIFVEDQRNGYTVKGQFSLKAWRLKIGQRVTLTSPFFGWSSKVFRVTDKSYSPGGKVELTLKEDSPLIWDFADAVLPDETPNSDLPNPWAINPIPSLSCESGEDVLLLQSDGTVVSRILASWPEIDSLPTWVVEVEWQEVGLTTWQRAQASAGETSALLAPVHDGSFYSVRARTLNPQLDVKSDWVYADPHKVVGKSEPPSAVTGYVISSASGELSHSWNRNAEVDMAGYEIRDTDDGWGGAGHLFRGNALQYIARPADASVGTKTHYIRAYDTSGNYSETASASYTIAAPINATTITASFADTSLTSATVTLEWSAAAPVFGLKGYEVTGSGAAKFVDSNTITLPANWIGNRTLTVKTIDLLGNKSSGRSLVVSKLAPNVPSNVRATPEAGALRVEWDAATKTTLPVWGYEGRKDTNFGQPGFLFKGATTDCTILARDLALGVNTFYFRTIDTDGNYSTNTVFVFEVLAPANTTAITEAFADTSLTNATVTLDWPEVAPVFGLEDYVVSYDSVVKYVKANTIALPANWLGSRSFTIRTRDQLGNLSSGFTKSITKLAPMPPTDVRAEVIDNNVLLYWKPGARTTLPVAHILIKEGAAWATAKEIGTKSGTFTSLSELEGGDKTYWLATVDTDNNPSAPVSIGAKVSQPPDFIFKGQQESDFSGALNSALLSDGAVVMPVNLTETWAQHFTSRGWTSPQDQINAGFPIFIQPSPASGSYVETFDFGTVVSSSMVNVAYSGEAVAGQPIVRTKIELSDDNAEWTVFDNVTQAFWTNFRYVRVTISVAGDGDEVYALKSLGVRLASKLKNDGGHVNCLAADASGTLAHFNMDFLDVTSLTVTAAGTTPVTAMYAFKDAVLAGTYSVSGGVATINVAAHELIVGQRVRLNFTTGNALPQTVEVSSVVNATSFRANVDSANTSGNVQIYPQSMRIYLFNQSGGRVSGTASWSIKGH